ncbi:sulfotransferase [Pelagibacteraceae bacterium]|nr:sulfotransferase [Pelagibacteraceae bacterium]
MSKKVIKKNLNDKYFYQNILKKNSNNYKAILNLGLIDVRENNFSLAKDKFKKLLNIDINKYEGHLNLSNIYSLEGNTFKANSILYDYLNNIKENEEIVTAIAINLLNKEELNNLEKHINKFINKYESYTLYYLKGFILAKAEKILESEVFFKKSISLNSVFWNNYDFLLKQYEKQSRLKDFQSLILTAKKIFKKNAKLSYYESLYFFRERDYEKSLKILINNKIEENFLSQQNEVDLADYLHLLSRVYEKLRFYNESYGLAIKRNKIILNFKENKKFNKELILNTISIYKNFFNKKNKPISNTEYDGINHSNLVFLIGFPRSGTTLLDTILRSHSKTLVLEEKPYLLDIRHSFYKNHQLSDILKINDVDKIQMQEKYFNSFEYKSDQLIIDKYPLNLIELGFIKTIFPKSKIVLAIRHPLDCIISCVMTAFKMNDGMVNFENIQTTSHFYNECFELLFNYFNYYQINYHQVKYENVIINFKDEVNNLLKFLNLNFEENINNFQETAKLRKKINTPSYDQVTQPLYLSSKNRYKNFDEIKNIKVNIKRWLNEFSY